MGMRLRGADCKALKGGFDAQHKEASFEIRIRARLAKARPEYDGGFVTRGKFNRD